MIRRPSRRQIARTLSAYRSLSGKLKPGSDIDERRTPTDWDRLESGRRPRRK